MDKETQSLCRSLNPLFEVYSKWDKEHVQTCFGLLQRVRDLTVKLLEDERANAASTLSAIDARDANAQSDEHIQRICDPGRTAAMLAAPARRTAVAIADWESDAPGDLSLCRGDVVVITRTHQSGWWEGQCDEKKGFFPAGYVVEEGAKESEFVDQVFLVACDFKPRQSNELELIEGDLVDVEVTLRSGMCRGVRVRDGKRGVFPLEILAIDKPLEN
jgi:hypothetical protein